MVSISDDELASWVHAHNFFVVTTDTSNADSLTYNTSTTNHHTLFTTMIIIYFH